jgi:ceramide glucosyltransferase
MVNALLLSVLAGLVSCTGFLFLVIIATVRFRRRQRQSKIPIPVRDLPPVTLLKPLCGLEPRLEENLNSFFQQDYPVYEIIFGARDATDPALRVVRRIQDRHPDVPVTIVFSGRPDRPNAKVCSLEKMVAAATHEYLIISDSDVHVAADYVTQVVRPLLDPQVGLVSCLYRGVPTGGIWSRLEALGMSVEMISGVVVADLLEGMRFALGPTMATRRGVLEAIGGVGALANYCADDYVLGQKVFESGLRVVMSSHVIEHVVLNRSFKHSVAHQVRWMKSTRFSRSAGHIGTGLTFALPFGLIGIVAGIAAHSATLAIALFGWAVLKRLLMSVTAGWGVVRDRHALRDCWLYPLRDLMGFCFWVASFLGTTIVWRHERYRLQPGGTMVRLAETEESAAVAVDSLA